MTSAERSKCFNLQVVPKPVEGYEVKHELVQSLFSGETTLSHVRMVLNIQSDNAVLDGCEERILERPLPEHSTDDLFRLKAVNTRGKSVLGSYLKDKFNLAIKLDVLHYLRV